MAMLAGLSSAARLLLLVLANPNWLLFVKNIKIAKVGENRALEVTTYSRNASSCEKDDFHDTNKYSV